MSGLVTMKTYGSIGAGSELILAPQTRVFYTAVVVEYISNPEYDLNVETDFKAKKEEDKGEEPLTLGESLEKGENQVSNIGRVAKMPRNSIVGWRIDDRASYESGPAIFYPFFSPHLCMPVAPGEQVWVTYEKVGDTADIGYWISRKPGSLHVDDICFTHHDRESTNVVEDQGPDKSAQKAIEGTKPNEYDPKSFPPGGGRQSSNNTLPKLEWEGSGEDAYQDIIDKSFSYINQFTGEPVPRWSSRCNSLTLQGANNTLISLGIDRTFDPNNSKDAAGKPATGPDIMSLAGTIDIVVGRGQEGSATAPVATFTNTREWDEVDKTPTATESADASNAFEGDVDFTTDLSRVYVSMNTSGDTNLGLAVTNSAAPVVDGSPYIIAKSTELRLVARDGGSVRMIKEGGAQCEICLMSDGAISIEGGTIYLGENSAGNTSQPVVQGTLLETACHNFASAISNALGVGTKCGNLDTDLTSAVAIDAACLAFTTQVTAALSTMVYTK